MVTTQIQLEILKKALTQFPAIPHLASAEANSSDSSDSGWCTLSEICHLLSIPNIDAKSSVRFQRRRIKAGQWLFGTGEKFSSVFIYCVINNIKNLAWTCSFPVKQLTTLEKVCIKGIKCFFARISLLYFWKYRCHFCRCRFQHGDGYKTIYKSRVK